MSKGLALEKMFIMARNVVHISMAQVDPDELYMKQEERNLLNKFRFHK